MTSEVQIVDRLGPEDLEQAVALELRSQDAPWSAAQVAEELARADGIRLGVRDGDGLLVGMLFAVPLAGTCHLLNLVVDPSRRRQGLARTLCERWLAEAAGACPDGVLLEVRAGNRPALGLYATLGFEPIGRRRGYYRTPPEDALVLARPVAT